jgi:predicted Zn-ribbon and HTH transcriptional regulator
MTHKGKWIQQEGLRLVANDKGQFSCMYAYECSRCGAEVYFEKKGVVSDWCPACRSEMDGEVELY